MRWAVYVTRMGESRGYTGFSRGNLRERNHLEDPGVDGKITLRWIVMKWGYELDILAQDRDRWWALVNAY